MDKKSVGAEGTALVAPRLVDASAARSGRPALDLAGWTMPAVVPRRGVLRGRAVGSGTLVPGVVAEVPAAWSDDALAVAVSLVVGGQVEFAELEEADCAVCLEYEAAPVGALRERRELVREMELAMIYTLSSTHKRSRNRLVPVRQMPLSESRNQVYVLYN